MKVSRSTQTAEAAGDLIDHDVIKIGAVSMSKNRSLAPLKLNSPGFRNFPKDAAPRRKPFGWMVLHPIGKLRSAHQAGLHRDVGEVGRGNGLLVAGGRISQGAENGDDLNHQIAPPDGT